MKHMTQASLPPRRLSVAPMLDWTDRHYRYLARQITRNTWLYSEMVNSGAIVYGDKDRFLMFNEGEQPVALQLGGSDPSDLAKAAKAAEEYGYNEVNLNCGCPSPRVQKGAFGACLMNEVDLVADCLNAMQDAVGIPVTVKHRIGVDRQTEYQVVADFVGTLREKTACRTFIVHARNAWLDGLSPKENREVPPLKYEYVYRLKQEFPNLEILIKGNVQKLNIGTNARAVTTTNTHTVMNIGNVAQQFNGEISGGIFCTETIINYSGDNEKMATALGISTKTMTILGLMLANGIISLAGAILAQNNGYSDVNSGIGVIVVALAAIIIGEVIFKDVSFTTRLICVICGAIIYRLLLVGVLKLNIIGANDFKLVSALVIAIFLTLPQLKLKAKRKDA